MCDEVLLTLIISQKCKTVIFFSFREHILKRKTLKVSELLVFVLVNAGLYIYNACHTIP